MHKCVRVRPQANSHTALQNMYSPRHKYDIKSHISSPRSGEANMTEHLCGFRLFPDQCPTSRWLAGINPSIHTLVPGLLYQLQGPMGAVAEAEPSRNASPSRGSQAVNAFVLQGRAARSPGSSLVDTALWKSLPFLLSTSPPLQNKRKGNGNIFHCVTKTFGPFQSV